MSQKKKEKSIENETIENETKDKDGFSEIQILNFKNPPSLDEQLSKLNTTIEEHEIQLKKIKDAINELKTHLPYFKGI
jgi:hypothetical protein